MEQQCSCPLQTLIIWIVAIDLALGVTWGWRILLRIDTEE